MTKQPNETELKPCPFSGKKAYLIKQGKNFEGRALYHIVCHKSGIRTKNYRDPKKAIKAWNTRAETKPVDVEALKKSEKMLGVLISNGDNEEYGYIKGWNDCLDHLKQKRVL